MVFSAAGHPINKGLLYGGVEVVVVSHVVHPALFQKISEDLANTGCQGYRAKVLG